MNRAHPAEASDGTETSPGSSRHRDRCSLGSLECAVRQVEPCEPRLALSASLAGDLFLDLLGVDPLDASEASPYQQGPPYQQASPYPQASPSEPGSTDTVPDLFAQATEAGEAHGLGGQGQTVAVIDSGVAWDHEALGGGFGPGYRVVGGWDFAEQDDDPYDDGPAGYHGTHVAGVLAGDSDFLVGVAPEADVVALRVFDDQGRGDLEWIESALGWVHENRLSFDSPITTVNLSVGAALSDANRTEALAMLEDELSQLRDAGVLVFAAGGNRFAPESPDEVLYPASSPSVVAVSSVDTSGALSGFAQREADIFTARGEGVIGSVPDHVFGWDGKVDDVATLNGTSMATPQVAGASMLIRQAMWDRGFEPTPDEILRRLGDSAVTRTDAVTGLSYRTVDLEAALRGIVGEPVPSGSSDGEAESAEPPQDVPDAIDRFAGGDTNESMVIDLRAGGVLRVGGESYRLRLEGSLESPLVIDAGGGVNQVEIIGSDSAERLVAHPPSSASGDVSRLSGNDFAIDLRRFQNVRFIGGGGPDRATFYDGPGDDTLHSEPGEVTLRGSGFRFEVHDVARTYAHATAGGSDTAFLYDSVGDDVLSVRPRFTSLRGEDSFQLAYGFSRVYAYAENGGFDEAELYDSAGGDVVSISPTRSILSSHGYQASARGFDSVVAHSIYGGDDLARIYADESLSRWHASDDMTQWTATDGTTRGARGFHRTLAFDRFEPVEIRPQSIPAGFASWLSDDRTERLRREAEALRAVFASHAEPDGTIRETDDAIR